MGLLDSSELLEAVGGGVSSVDGDIVDALRSEDAIDVPIEFTDMEVWMNYTNDDLYAMDKKIRDFLHKTRYARSVEKNKKGCRTTASIVFAYIYGRQPSPADGSACKIINKLLEYYCTDYTGPTTFMGKPVRRVYRFSKYSALKRRPYSLRLRLEEANDAGKTNANIFKPGPGAYKDKQAVSRRKNRVPRDDADV